MNTAQRIGYVHYIIYYGTVLEKVNNFIYLDSKMSHVVMLSELRLRGLESIMFGETQS